ncbi:MAG: NAD-dependent protein deacylase [Ruminococcus sp.]|nr:NAD-dependent protein deacylase [Ruminococcus sp.]
MNEIERLNAMVNECENIVFFGGAGVSTESGVPDFRSKDGLYNQKYDYPPEVMLSHSFYKSHPEDFFKFYKDKMLIEGVEPNDAHKKLAELEAKGKLQAVVTQNIDGLHQKAGSKCVYELHGSVLRNYCEKCHRFYDFDFMKNASGVPTCTDCGGRVKPDVVLYEEGLDNNTVNGAVEAIAKADMLIIGGTSLVVYPAAGLVRYFNGKYLVLINRDETPMDSECDLVIHEKIGEVMKQIKL